MAGDLRLGIRLTADSKGFVGEVKVARRELDKLGAGVRKAGGANAEYNRAIKQSTKTTRGFGESLAKAHGRAISYIGGIGSIALATRSLLRHADSYTQISNAVRIATGSAAEHAQVSEALFGIAQRTRAPLTAVADLYQKLSISAVDLGASNAEMLGVIEGVGQALVINGTSAAQASGALLQLSQALGGVDDVVIHDDMLPHIADHEDKARVRFANRLLPTLEDPDEVWLAGYKNDRGDYEFRRHFIRGWDDKKATFTVVAEGADGWLFYTFFPTRKEKEINKRRLGELLYFRPEDGE